MAEKKATAEIDPALLAAIKAQIRAEMEAENAVRTAPKTAKVNNPIIERENKRLEEKEQVLLFRDGKDYKDDVFVSVNGQTVAIQRGKPVMIKKKFVQALKASDRQQTAANDYALRKQEEYRNESRKYS